jgi:hypothetical protein
VLGIAYPCLEDGLNDFAVVRTAYETLELFSTDDAMRRELHEIISDARRTLIRRLMELWSVSSRARRTSGDRSRRVQVVSSRSNTSRLSTPPARPHDESECFFLSGSGGNGAAKTSTHAEHSLYHYEFHNSDDGERLAQLSGRDFLLSLLGDVLDSVMDAENYRSKYLFDRNVFQQFIALILSHTRPRIRCSTAFTRTIMASVAIRTWTARRFMSLSVANCAA